MKEEQEKPGGMAHKQKIPTCAELASILSMFGDQPLISGKSDYAINGFYVAADGFVRTSAQKYDPDRFSKGMEVKQ